jgi:hypothetical protein
MKKDLEANTDGAIAQLFAELLCAFSPLALRCWSISLACTAAAAANKELDGRRAQLGGPLPVYGVLTDMRKYFVLRYDPPTDPTSAIGNYSIAARLRINEQTRKTVLLDMIDSEPFATLSDERNVRFRSLQHPIQLHLCRLETRPQASERHLVEALGRPRRMPPPLLHMVYRHSIGRQEGAEASSLLVSPLVTGSFKVMLVLISTLIAPDRDADV